MATVAANLRNISACRRLAMIAAIIFVIADRTYARRVLALVVICH
ncbi:MAG: hypothetical protein ABR535_10685 [Pyrinomonadaceae bacterium]